MKLPFSVGWLFPFLSLSPPFLLQLLFAMNLAGFKIWKQKCIVLCVLSVLTMRALREEELAMQTTFVAFAE